MMTKDTKIYGLMMIFGSEAVFGPFFAFPLHSLSELKSLKIQTGRLTHLGLVLDKLKLSKRLKQISLGHCEVTDLHTDFSNFEIECFTLKVSDLLFLFITCVL